MTPSLATQSLGSMGSTAEATPNSLHCSRLCMPQLHTEAWAEGHLRTLCEMQVGEEVQECSPAAYGHSRLFWGW